MDNQYDIDDIWNVVNGNGVEGQEILNNLQMRTPLKKVNINLPADPVQSASSTDNVMSILNNLEIPNTAQIQNAKNLMRQMANANAGNNNGGINGGILKRPRAPIPQTQESQIPLTSSPIQLQSQAPIPAPTPAPVQTSTTSSTPLDPSSITNGTQFIVPDHMSLILGYQIPSKTLYFIIILVIIAVTLYFLTAEKKKPKKDKKDEKDE